MPGGDEFHDRCRSARARARAGDFLHDLVRALSAAPADQCAISTGSFALARTYRVVPPKIIWRSRLCV